MFEPIRFNKSALFRDVNGFNFIERNLIKMAIKRWLELLQPPFCRFLRAMLSSVKDVLFLDFTCVKRLLTEEPIYKKENIFRTRLHDIYTVEQNKKTKRF
jgi:hypothetical protein